MIDLTAIAARAREFAAAQEAASPGTWVFDESEAGTANGDAYWGLISGEDDPWLRRPLGVHVRFRSCGLFGNSKSPEGEEEQARCDAKMIVAARNTTLAADVLALLAEVERLRNCMQRAGLQAFIRNGTPEAIAEHFEHIAKANTEHMDNVEKRLREAEELLHDWMENTSHYEDYSAKRCRCDRCNETAAFLRQSSAS